MWQNLGFRVPKMPPGSRIQKYLRFLPKYTLNAVGVQIFSSDCQVFLNLQSLQAPQEL